MADFGWLALLFCCVSNLANALMLTSLQRRVGKLENNRK